MVSPGENVKVVFSKEKSLPTKISMYYALDEYPIAVLSPVAD